MVLESTKIWEQPKIYTGMYLSVVLNLLQLVVQSCGITEY